MNKRVVLLIKNTYHSLEQLVRAKALINVNIFVGLCTNVYTPVEKIVLC